MSNSPARKPSLYDSQNYRSLEDDTDSDRQYYATVITGAHNNTTARMETDGLLPRSGSAVNHYYSDEDDNNNTDRYHKYTGNPTLDKVLRWEVLAIGVIAIIIIIAALTSSLVMSKTRLTSLANDKHCSTNCRYQLVESIPDQVNLALLPGTDYTYNSWISLIDNSKHSLKIAAFYSSLRNNFTSPDEKNIGGWMGNNVMDAIIRAQKRGVSIHIVQNSPLPNMAHADTDWLRDNKIAKVTYVDWSAAMNGGVLHTKMIIADDSSFYVGSANFDWTSLAQVKELGVYVTDCTCLTHDITKVWSAYQFLGSTLKSNLKGSFVGFPGTFQTQSSLAHPLNMSFANFPGEFGNVFISSSPQAINPPDRTNDIVALLNVINTAQKSLSISVMDYLPLDSYGSPRVYWGEIEDALKNAITRNVTVRMLISKWPSTSRLQTPVVESLNKFGEMCKYSYGKNGSEPWCTGSITVKLFHIPPAEGYDYIPFTRVNHAKYMVSEKMVYLSTSNWSFDYFYRTAGVSFITTHTHFRQTTQDIFDRDWTSSYVLSESKQEQMTHDDIELFSP